MIENFAILQGFGTYIFNTFVILTNYLVASGEGVAMSSTSNNLAKGQIRNDFPETLIWKSNRSLYVFPCHRVIGCI